jgi:hypothetical protein
MSRRSWRGRTHDDDFAGDIARLNVMVMVTVAPTVSWMPLLTWRLKCSSDVSVYDPGGSWENVEAGIIRDAGR